jgi:hypothetical protein
MNRRIAFFLFGTTTALLAATAIQAGDNDWIRSPVKSYEINALKVEDMSGTLTVDVKDGGPTTLEINGVQWKVARVGVRQSGRELTIKGTDNRKVWNWRSWFDFRHGGRDEAKNLYVHLTVPRGTAVKVDSLIGNAIIGNIEAPLKFDAVGDTDTRIGNVASADVSLAGSGKIKIANVAGRLNAETAGSGDIRSGDACDVHAEIAGSGSISVAKAKCKLHVEIAGSGDFSAASVSGPTHIEIAGSGSVSIADGEANPMHVEIMGSGDVSFGGMAVDPNIESMGSGSVRLKAYRGNLHTEGNSSLKIGK